MLRHLFILLCGVWLTPSAVPIGMADTPGFEVARWQEALTRQVEAAQAEVAALQGTTPDTAKLEQQQRLQAEEWTKVLVRQLDHLPPATSVPGDHTQSWELRVPGISPAFAADRFSTISLPATARSDKLASELIQLTVELDSLSPVVLQRQAIHQQIDRLESLLPIDPSLQEQLAGLRMQLRRQPLEPQALDEMLAPTIVRFPVGSSTSSHPVINTLAVQWVIDSRQLLMTQLAREIQTLKQDDVPWMAATDTVNTPNDRIPGLNDTLGQLQIRGRHLRREWEAAQTSSAVRAAADGASRSGQLLHVSRDAWQRARERTLMAQQVHMQQQQTEEFFSQLAEQDDQFRIDHQDSVRLTRLAAAHLDAVSARERQRESVLKYAMEVYRMDSGRATDNTALHAQLFSVFEAAGDIDADRKLLEIRSDWAQRRLMMLRQQRQQGDAAWEAVHTAATEVELLALQQNRLEYREELATLALLLARQTTNQATLAHRSSERRTSTEE